MTRGSGDVYIFSDSDFNLADNNTAVETTCRMDILCLSHLPDRVFFLEIAHAHEKSRWTINYIYSVMIASSPGSPSTCTP